MSPIIGNRRRTAHHRCANKKKISSTGSGCNILRSHAELSSRNGECLPKSRGGTDQRQQAASSAAGVNRRQTIPCDAVCQPANLGNPDGSAPDPGIDRDPERALVVAYRFGVLRFLRARKTVRLWASRRQDAAAPQPASRHEGDRAETDGARSVAPVPSRCTVASCQLRSEAQTWLPTDRLTCAGGPGRGIL